MAFGRDHERDRKDAEAMRRRRQKQAGYQLRYRERLAAEKIPERGSLADCALSALVEIMASREDYPQELKALAFGRRMLDALERQGFDRKGSKDALMRIVTRVRDGIARDAREARLEAAYQARKAEEGPA